MAHTQQLAVAAAILTGNPNMLAMMQQDAAAAAAAELSMGEHGLHGHHPDLHQQTRQHAAAYAHAMPGATNMTFHPGGSTDAEAFLVQPQKVNALALQTDSSLPPSLADSPRQQPIDGGDHDDKLSDLTAYFGIPGPKPPRIELIIHVMVYYHLLIHML
ncbi:hypothetical protein EJB05_14985, partial [Eragrostis curvula]